MTRDSSRILVSVLVMAMLAGFVGPDGSLQTALAKNEYGLSVSLDRHMTYANDYAYATVSKAATAQCYEAGINIFDAARNTRITRFGPLGCRAGPISPVFDLHPSSPTTLYVKAVLADAQGTIRYESDVDAVTFGKLDLTAPGGRIRKVGEKVQLTATMTPARLEAHYYIAIYHVYYLASVEHQDPVIECINGKDFGRVADPCSGTVTSNAPTTERYLAVIKGPSIAPGLSQEKEVEWTEGAWSAQLTINGGSSVTAKPGDTVTFDMRSNQDLIQGHGMYLVDKTTGKQLYVCYNGADPRHCTTQAQVTNQSMVGKHTIVAEIRGNPSKGEPAVLAQAAVTLTVKKVVAGVTIRLTASATSLAVGTRVTLQAVTSRTLHPGEIIAILAGAQGAKKTQVAQCTSGSACSGTPFRKKPGTERFVAAVLQNGKSLVVSKAVNVTWTGAASACQKPKTLLRTAARPLTRLAAGSWTIVCELVQVTNIGKPVVGRTITARVGEFVFITVQLNAPVEPPYFLGLWNEDKNYVQTACSVLNDKRTSFSCSYHSDDPTTLHLSLAVLKEWLPPPVWKSQPYTLTWK